jgi:hypothetical protein
MNTFRIAVTALSLFAIVGGANAATSTYSHKMKPHVASMHKTNIHCEKGKHCPAKNTVHMIKASTKK